MLKLPQDEIKVIVHTKNKSALLFTFTLSLSFTLRSFLFPQHTLAVSNCGGIVKCIRETSQTVKSLDKNFKKCECAPAASTLSAHYNL